ARRLGMAREPSGVQQAFYARCLSMLAKLGFVREPHETPDEFTRRAISAMHSGNLKPPPNLPHSLRLVTQVYYRLRFGPATPLTHSEQASIDQALEELAAVSGKRQ